MLMSDDLSKAGRIFEDFWSDGGDLVHYVIPQAARRTLTVSADLGEVDEVLEDMQWWC